MPSLMQTKREAGSTNVVAFERVADNFREGLVLSSADASCRHPTHPRGEAIQGGRPLRTQDGDASPLLNNLQPCLAAGLA